MLTRRIPLLAAALTLLATTVAGPALADKYVKLPKLDKKATALEIRFVRYTGGTNGEMVVDIRNRGKHTETFTAESLFFVPNGDPENAPQRLGAAGPFRVEKDKQWIVAEDAAIAPGKTERVFLQVFCIDSHRSSPAAKHKFSVARERLPKKLRGKINAETKNILRKNKGDMKRSKSAIQSHIWESRDGDWVKLEGERKAEKSPRKINPQRRNRIHKTPIRNQQRFED